MSHSDTPHQNTATTRVKTPLVQLYHGSVADVVRSIAPVRPLYLIWTVMVAMVSPLALAASTWKVPGRLNR